MEFDLQVLGEVERGEVHHCVLEMMKGAPEAQRGVLNLTARGTGLAPARDPHLFSEYMDTPGADMSISDSEEVMAYVNMKVRPILNFKTRKHSHLKPLKHKYVCQY